MCLLYSLKAQTYPNWEAIIVHDGEAPKSAWDLLYSCDPARIHMAETPERKGQFGHPWREWGIKRASGQYIGLSNDDNYYAPVYFSEMLFALQAGKAQLALCDMVHSHRQWGTIKGELKRGSVDVGSWIAEAELVKSTPWPDMGFAGDWTFIHALKHKAAKTVKVGGCFFVHN